MKIIAGLSNPDLAIRIARTINVDVIPTKIDNFNDGELRVQILDLIGDEITIIQSTSHPANNHLMELLLLADTAKRAGAKNIIALIPYFGYSRQDRCTYKYGPLSASLIIKMIEAAGINKVITLELHSPQLESAFNIPIINLDTANIFSQIYEQNHDTTIVSPDIGGISRARNFSTIFGTDLAIINKSRDKNNGCFMSEFIGQIKGKKCILVDDIVDTGNTICMAAELLMANGAREVEAYITHAVLSGPAIYKIQQSALKRIYITDSIVHHHLPDKFKILHVHELLSWALKV